MAAPVHLLLACGVGLAFGVAAREECAPQAANGAPSAFAWPQSGAASADDERDAACLVTASAVRNAPADSPIVWVDVRRAAEIRRQPLPGVVEIALADLPGKTFLQNERLILVGSGFDHRAVLAACRRLRASGWRIDVLDGGAFRWPAAGRADRHAAHLTPAEFLQAANDSHWRIIGVGLDEAALKLLPQRPAFALADDRQAPEQLRAAIDRLRRAKPPGGHPDVDILIVAAGAEAGERLRRAVAQSGPAAEAHWLEGGWAAFSHYLEQQQRIALAAGRSLKRPCGAP